MTVRSLIGHILAFASSDALVAKLMRFGIVGLASGLVFAGVGAAATGWFGVEPKMASVIGYLASMPLNFLGNRRFSFRSGTGLVGDLARFVLLHAFNMGLTAATIGVIVDWLHLHYAIGMVAVVVLIPIVNFAVMNLWVFRKPAGSATRG